MKKNMVFALLLCIGLGMGGSPVFAGDCPFSFHLSGLAVPGISGDAGNGTNAPDYDDAFDMGLGFCLEGVYRVSGRFGVVLGAGYEVHQGNGYQGIDFDDQSIMPVYLGGIWYFSQAPCGWIPYLRADLGFARLGGVDVSYLGVSQEYWKSSWELMADIGMGGEYKKDNVGFFIEMRARYLDGPSSAMAPYSDAGSNWSLPLLVGVSFYF